MNPTACDQSQRGDKIMERCREINVKQALRNPRRIIDWLYREREKRKMRRRTVCRCTIDNRETVHEPQASEFIQTLRYVRNINVEDRATLSELAE